ncbi:MAG: cbb3-type cytochrome oxidase assembly protein CcoS [Gammaproteobacteria bacterium]|nr:cbb3-type cytochrome oxidase assembly protein CcoS [Gammaproteobacteria bacterium]
MTILYLLIPLGLLLLAVGIAAFFWAAKSGQFDDLDSPAWSVVMDDDRAPGIPSKKPVEHANQDESIDDST